MPSIKEPHFFGADLHSAKFVRDRRDYIELFTPRHGERLLGEASVYYLYSQTAATELDMIHSLHSQAVSSAYEDILDFSEALSAEEDRARGQRIPDIADFPQGLLYRRIGMYAEQVRRYLATFPPEQVHVILFDDFVRDTEAVYVDVLRFLGVYDLNYRPEFKRVNENRRLAFVALEHFVKRRTSIRRQIKALSPRLYSSLYSTFRGLNARPARREEMAPELRKQLIERFASDVAALSALLDRDLSAWRN